MKKSKRNSVPVSDRAKRTRKNRVARRVKRSQRREATGGSGRARMRANDQPGGWKPDDVRRLQAAILEGLSYGQIVKFRLKGYTRNAVIGKCHRLGIREKMTAPEAAIRSAQHNNASHFSDRVSRFKRHALKPQGKTAQLYALATKGGGVSDAAMKAVLGLKEGEHCKWPIGDPKSAQFHFCTCPPKTGEPYCEDHHKAAYEPSQPAKTREHQLRGVARFADFVDRRKIAA